jgi:hypothetical protein
MQFMQFMQFMLCGQHWRREIPGRPVMTARAWGEAVLGGLCSLYSQKKSVADKYVCIQLNIFIGCYLYFSIYRLSALFSIDFLPPNDRINRR